MKNLRGISLVEILVAVAIMAIMLAVAAPNFADWIQNAKIRNAAEAMQNGLNLAKSEAVHRNTIAQFISCGGSSWTVVAASATASTFVCASTTASNGWEGVQARSNLQGSDNATVDATQTTVGFNGMGRQSSTTDILGAVTTPNPPVSVTFNISTASAGGACFCPAGTCGYPATVSYSTTGKLRCQRITVAAGGQIRMCDPALAAGSPQGC